jgi:protein-disulfide isomerase
LVSDKKEREKRREQRLQEESRVQQGDRRTRLLQFSAGAIFLVIAVVVVLIVVSSSSDSGGDAQSLEGVGSVDRLLAGIPQEGLVLGDPGAKVELVEFGDLQCPVCKAYSEEVLPQVIEGPVREGKVKIAFRNFTIIGPQSETAGAAALAAGAQRRGWQYLELFYRNQGREDSGYADDEFLTAIARGAGVEDVARWNRERKASKFTGKVSATTAEAGRLGLTGTPTFAIEGPGTKGLEVLGTPGSAGELESAIESAG